MENILTSDANADELNADTATSVVSSCYSNKLSEKE